MTWLEIQFWQIAKWIIRRGYGANCETSDIDEGILGKELSSEVITHSGRCPSCRAKEVIDWIDSHIDLIKN